jgi:hypothetical protein
MDKATASIFCMVLLSLIGSGCEEEVDQEAVWREQLQRTNDKFSAETRQRTDALIAAVEHAKAEAAAVCAAGGQCEVPLQNSGSWSLYETPDPLTGKKALRIALTNSASTAPYDTAFLNLVCNKDRKSEAYLAIRKRVASSAQIVGIRIDQAEPQKWRAEPAVDNEGLFLTRPSALAKAMINAKRVLFQYKPVGEPEVTVTFEVVGLATAAARLIEACKW